jgi:hypothetical protein
MVKLQLFLVPLFIAAAAMQSATGAPSAAPAAAPKTASAKTSATPAAALKTTSAKTSATPADAPKAAAATKSDTVAPPKAAAKTVAKIPAKPKLPNWVGPQVGTPTNNACYRKSYLTTKKQCSAGYNFDGALGCWAQCPIEYPVECGVECIQQNKDCTKEILGKVTSVANVALNAATTGVFGQLHNAAKGVQVAVRCTQQLYNTVTKISGFIDEIEDGGAGASKKDKIVFAVMKSDFVIYDLPVAIATCIGIPVPPELGNAKVIIKAVQIIVDVVVTKKIAGVSLHDVGTFLHVIKKEVPAVAQNVTATPADEAALKNLVKNGVTCGADIYSVVNKVIAAVQEIKTKTPSSPVDIIKFSILNSNLVLTDLPKAASSCVDTATGFSKRDEILKSAHVIIDGVMHASSTVDGKPLSKTDYAFLVSTFALDSIALIDPTGIAAMASKFVQPICGPTIYLGNIDSGPADKALGLKTVEKAFRGSTGTWAAKGDGQLKITFKSVDNHDVDINVIVGGKKMYSVPVKKGTSVVWTQPLSKFQGKTLYLDRWRAGLFGLPGTGGGSLLAWVPSHAATGSFDLQCTINPTSFSDHKLRHRD